MKALSKEENKGCNGNAEENVLYKSQGGYIGHQSSVNCLYQLHHGDSDDFLSGSCDYSVIQWKLNSMNSIRSISGFHYSVNCIIQLINGKIVIGTYNTILIYDHLTLKSINSFQGHSDFVYCIIELSNGLIASGSRDSKILLWDSTTMAIQTTLEGHTNSVYCLMQLKSGKLLSGACDNNICLWDITSYKCEMVIKEHKDSISALAEIDERSFASSGYDSKIKVWKDFKCITTITGHQSYLLCLICLKDGRLLSGGNDYWIRVWNVKTWKCEVAIYLKHSPKAVIQLRNNGLIACAYDKLISLYELGPKTDS